MVLFPEMVRPPFAVPSPMVDEALIRIPTVLVGVSAPFVSCQSESSPEPPQPLPVPVTTPLLFTWRHCVLPLIPVIASDEVVALVNVDDAAVTLPAKYPSPWTVRRRDGVVEPMPTLPLLLILKSERPVVLATRKRFALSELVPTCKLLYTLRLPWKMLLCASAFVKVLPEVMTRLVPPNATATKRPLP